MLLFLSVRSNFPPIFGLMKKFFPLNGGVPNPGSCSDLSGEKWRHGYGSMWSGRDLLRSDQ
ncbi:hypothetical protein CIT31_11610 [Mesorhizobium wenxiniae]|uniref:Uncharacterized protein n=1 Tax=Mesorhizobium wenxiniae TaxID=2014805 RepID=A0A271KG42_9HYPH|nr:hypothetical protein CIT31_11610 [Mesorhizobium wenxiniae]